MRALRLAWSARTATFVVHALVGLAAVIAVAPISAMLESALGDHPDGEALLLAHGGAAWVDITYGWGDALRAGIVSPILVGTVVAIVSGPLTCGWIATIGRAEHGATHLVRQCVLLGPRAWLLEIVALAARAAVAAIALGAGAGAAAVGGALGDDRVAGIAAAAAFALAALLLIPAGAATDLARAEIALGRGRVLPAAWLGLRAAVCAPHRTTAVYATLGSLGLALALVSLAAGELLAGPGGASAVAVLAAQQTLLLGRTFVRSCWLASCALRVARPVNATV